MPNPIVQFDDQKAEIQQLKVLHYQSNNAMAVIAVMFWDDGMRENVKVSINLNHDQHVKSHELPEGSFVAKSYFEGYPVFSALIEAGWIEETGRTVQTGYVDAPVCRITDKAQIEE